MPTYASTGIERVDVLETYPDGRQRIASATKQADTSNATFPISRWSYEISFPSGRQWSGIVSGPRHEVAAELSRMLRSRDEEFRQDAARGDVPIYEPERHRPV
jgi:hypothetical protein